ncbi:MAG: hypothetical protein LH614_09780 [Pyrinomonadaceae bacterium]|nr:hypothetical protein [Pyrinomonadaceae bacterium]
MSYQFPNSEQSRLHALKNLDILDIPAEQEFDDLKQPAATVCDTPIALITLIDSERQWFKLKVGFETGEIPRDPAFSVRFPLNKNSRFPIYSKTVISPDTRSFPVKSEFDFTPVRR